MSDFSAGPRAQVFTTWGTLLFVDAATGQLRHGPADTSPGNLFFICTADARTDRIGFLARLDGDSLQPIVQQDDGRLSTASWKNAAPRLLSLVHLERGLIGFQNNGLFLSAEHGGEVTLSKNWCSTWEFFLLSEDWCYQHLGRSEPATGRPGINKRLLQDCIVDPRLRVMARRNSKAKKVLIYGYTQWSHGRVYYDLCKHLSERGYIVDILNWRVSHASYIHEILPFYDLYLTALDGVHTLVKSYGAPLDKIVALSHGAADIRMLTEQMGGAEVFAKFANYGVVSESLYCLSQMSGVQRIPHVAELGINYSEFFSEVPSRLEIVGYASSMSLKTYGVELKRGELVKAAAEEAGLTFRIAGSTAEQVSIHDMPAFYRGVDVVVNSSISEAAQLPVMEAAAAGRLVIGTPVGHFPRRAYQGGGILAPVEARRFKSFTRDTLKYYKDDPAAFVDKCKSIQEAAKQFDWQYSIGEWIELIETAWQSEASKATLTRH